MIYVNRCEVCGYEEQTHKKKPNKLCPNCKHKGSMKEIKKINQ